MEIEKEISGEIDIFRVNGRLDTETTPVLEKNVQVDLEAGRKTILLDFVDVEYLSSAGMRFLLAVSKKLQEDGGRLGLFSIQENVMDVIKVAGFDQVLKIYPNEAAAMA